MAPDVPFRPDPALPPIPPFAGGAAPETRTAFKPGDRLGQLDIVEKIGEGLHGEVFLAAHRHTGELSAIKAMHLADAQDAKLVQRHLRTAVAAHRIRCANVVTVRDVGCEDNGVVWLQMELLEGHSVAELLARQGGRMSVPLAFHIAINGAWGVDAAHELRIIHRDIKPGNLWLCTDGTVKVLDFGLAKVVPDGVETTKRTTVSGTLPYMAPEALRGLDSDARVDVYSLGMVLWEMLGGHPWGYAFGNEAEMTRTQLWVEPPSLAATAGLPPYVDDFMTRVLAKDRAKRFLSVSAMAQAMMAQRDRLLADAAQSVFRIVVPPGEPPVPADTDGRGRREALARQSVPELHAPPEEPAERVVLSSPASPLAARVGPGGTVPFKTPSLVGPSGTLPFGARLPVPVAPLPPAQPVVAAPPDAAPSPPMRAPEIENELPAGVPRPRSYGVLIALALALGAGLAMLLVAPTHGKPHPPDPGPAVTHETAAQPETTAPPPGNPTTLPPPRSGEGEPEGPLRLPSPPRGGVGGGVSGETTALEPAPSAAPERAPSTTPPRQRAPKPSAPAAPRPDDKPAQAKSRLFGADP